MAIAPSGQATRTSWSAPPASEIDLGNSTTLGLWVTERTEGSMKNRRQPLHELLLADVSERTRQRP